MSSLDELIERARLLLSEGHSPGQIADELSLSIETVTWLLTQQKSGATPKDVGIDWTAVSSEGPLLDELAMMMLKRYYSAISDGSMHGVAQWQRFKDSPDAAVAEQWVTRYRLEWRVRF